MCLWDSKAEDEGSEIEEKPGRGERPIVCVKGSQISDYNGKSISVTDYKSREEVGLEEIAKEQREKDMINETRRNGSCDMEVDNKEFLDDTGTLTFKRIQGALQHFSSPVKLINGIATKSNSGECKRLLDFQGVVSGKAEVLKGQVNLLRVELGEVQLTKLLGGKRWIRCHGIPSLVAKPLGLVPLFLTNTVEERAFPFRREAAKKDSELMSFGCVLWRKEEASILKSRFGLELAPAVVFIKDPGVQPITVYGSSFFCYLLNCNLMCMLLFLPQLQSITASKLGCDPADFSAAGKDVETWYCIVVAGRPGFQLDQLCSKFCYYCLPSEPVHKTCRPRQYQVQDVARILMIRFRRDPTSKAGGEENQYLVAFEL
ncbi:hypothetical protein SELMODRAFT_431930 [Selaginella moellendorffii]|uniref:Uncharacterized protein n=1 Tax=Selaginella moellendorffii TaxID=88036 RepID=D8TEF0_SELML|nr:hypothetical protein SELMODRAFT_431930 [Selaginella moellendorffii]